jgi:hypothetical protein
VSERVPTQNHSWSCVLFSTGSRTGFRSLFRLAQAQPPVSDLQLAILLVPSRDNVEVVTPSSPQLLFAVVVRQVELSHVVASW